MKDSTGKKQKAEFSLSTLKANVATRKQLEGFIEELVLCHGKIKTEKESIKDIVTEAKDSLGIPGKLLNKLVKENMKPGTIEAEVKDLDEAQKIAETIDNPQAQFSSTDQPD